VLGHSLCVCSQEARLAHTRCAHEMAQSFVVAKLHVFFLEEDWWESIELFDGLNPQPFADRSCNAVFSFWMLYSIIALLFNAVKKGNIEVEKGDQQVDFEECFTMLTSKRTVMLSRSCKNSETWMNRIGRCR